jgi:hypothetical protein
VFRRLQKLAELEALDLAHGLQSFLMPLSQHNEDILRRIREHLAEAKRLRIEAMKRQGRVLIGRSSDRVLR